MGASSLRLQRTTKRLRYPRRTNIERFLIYRILISVMNRLCQIHNEKTRWRSVSEEHWVSGRYVGGRGVAHAEGLGHTPGGKSRTKNTSHLTGDTGSPGGGGGGAHDDKSAAVRRNH